MTYTPNAVQHQIIASTAPLLVVLGGAGTGKTTTAVAAARVQPRNGRSPPDGSAEVFVNYAGIWALRPEDRNPPSPAQAVPKAAPGRHEPATQSGRRSPQ